MNDYGDLAGADGASRGTSSRSRRRSRRARRPTARDVTVGRPRLPGAARAPGIPDGPQWVLEYWSDNVAQRVPVHPHRGHRLRPDRRRTSSTSPTPASRGRSRTAPGGCAAGRPARAARIMNGRIFKMVLDPNNPLAVRRLSMLIDADARRLQQRRARSTSRTTSRRRRTASADPGGPGQPQPGSGRTATRRSGGSPLPAGAPVPVAQVNQSLRPRSPDRLVGVERHRRRLRGVRPGRVPRRRAGARLRDRDRAEPVPGDHATCVKPGS